MQLIDPTAIATYLVVVGVASLVALAIGVAALAFAFRETRRDRLDRHESIPAYYGGLHFAH